MSPVFVGLINPVRVLNDKYTGQGISYREGGLGYFEKKFQGTKLRGASLVLRLSCAFVYAKDELIIHVAHLRGAKKLSGAVNFPPCPPPPKNLHLR